MAQYRDCPKCGGWGIRPQDETHCIHCMGKGKFHTKESLLQLLADEKGVPMHDLGKLEPSERAEVLAEMTRRAQAPRSAKKQAELEEELRAYEVKYGMTTEEMFRSGLDTEWTSRWRILANVAGWGKSAKGMVE